MSTKAFDKRMRFVALATNAGHDTLKANEWYCSHSKRERETVSLEDLLAQFALDDKKV